MANTVLRLVVEDKRMLGLIWDITDEGEVEFFCQGQFQKSLPEVECAEYIAKGRIYVVRDLKIRWDVRTEYEDLHIDTEGMLPHVTFKLNSIWLHNTLKWNEETDVDQHRFVHKHNVLGNLNFRRGKNLRDMAACQGEVMVLAFRTECDVLKADKLADAFLPAAFRPCDGDAWIPQLISDVPKLFMQSLLAQHTQVAEDLDQQRPGPSGFRPTPAPSKPAASLNGVGFDLRRPAPAPAKPQEPVQPVPKTAPPAARPAPPVSTPVQPILNPAQPVARSERAAEPATRPPSVSSTISRTPSMRSVCRKPSFDELDRYEGGWKMADSVISGIVGVVVKQFGNVSKVRTVRGYSFAPVPLKEGSWLCMETKRDGVMRARVIVPPCETRVLQADDGALHLGLFMKGGLLANGAVFNKFLGVFCNESSMVTVRRFLDAEEEPDLEFWMEVEFDPDVGEGDFNILQILPHSDSWHIDPVQSYLANMEDVTPSLDDMKRALLENVGNCMQYFGEDAEFANQRSAGCGSPVARAQIEEVRRVFEQRPRAARPEAQELPPAAGTFDFRYPPPEAAVEQRDPQRKSIRSQTRRLEPLFRVTDETDEAPPDGQFNDDLLDRSLDSDSSVQQHPVEKCGFVPPVNRQEAHGSDSLSSTTDSSIRPKFVEAQRGLISDSFRRGSHTSTSEEPRTPLNNDSSFAPRSVSSSSLGAANEEVVRPSDPPTLPTFEPDREPDEDANVRIPVFTYPTENGTARSGSSRQPSVDSSAGFAPRAKYGRAGRTVRPSAMLEQQRRLAEEDRSSRSDQQAHLPGDGADGPEPAVRLSQQQLENLFGHASFLPPVMHMHAALSNVSEEQPCTAWCLVYSIIPKQYAVLLHPESRSFGLLKYPEPDPRISLGCFVHVQVQRTATLVGNLISFVARPKGKQLLDEDVQAAPEAVFEEAHSRGQPFARVRLDFPAEVRVDGHDQEFSYTSSQFGTVRFSNSFLYNVAGRPFIAPFRLDPDGFWNCEEQFATVAPGEHQDYADEVFDGPQPPHSAGPRKQKSSVPAPQQQQVRQDADGGEIRTTLRSFAHLAKPREQARRVQEQPTEEEPTNGEVDLGQAGPRRVSSDRFVGGPLQESRPAKANRPTSTDSQNTVIYRSPTSVQPPPAPSGWLPAKPSNAPSGPSAPSQERRTQNGSTKSGSLLNGAGEQSRSDSKRPAGAVDFDPSGFMKCSTSDDSFNNTARRDSDEPYELSSLEDCERQESDEAVDPDWAGLRAADRGLLRKVQSEESGAGGHNNVSFQSAVSQATHTSASADAKYSDAEEDEEEPPPSQPKRVSCTTHFRTPAPARDTAPAEVKAQVEEPPKPSPVAQPAPGPAPTPAVPLPRGLRPASTSTSAAGPSNSKGTEVPAKTDKVSPSAPSTAPRLVEQELATVRAVPNKYNEMYDYGFSSEEEDETSEDGVADEQQQGGQDQARTDQPTFRDTFGQLGSSSDLDDQLADLDIDLQ